MAKSPNKTTAKIAPETADVALISSLAAILDERDLTEIEYETDALSVRLSRTPHLAAQVSHAPPAAMSAAAPMAAAAAPAAEPAVSVISGDPIASPMVGTAYLAPEPSASDFVKEGDMVQEGQTLLIIEAMKVMNPIAAPRAGKIKAILISNGQPIEFGEDLMILE